MTPRRPPGAPHRRWDPAEDALLRELAVGDLSAARLGQRFPGRTGRAIASRLHHLGLLATPARRPDCYTITQVAAVLGASKESVRDWLLRGDLRPTTVPLLYATRPQRPVRLLVDPADLDDFITAHPYLFSLAGFPEGPHRSTLLMARPQEWMNRREVAAFLDMRPNTVSGLVWRGRLPCVRFGAFTFFRRRDVLRYREERARQRMRKPRHARYIDGLKRQTRRSA